MTEPGRVVNALTVDVEEYFHVTNLSGALRPEDWEGLASSVRPNTERILARLEAAGVKATFFVLGWVAERDPDLVRAISSRGHEIACHGYDHRVAGGLTRGEFRADVRRARELLASISGQPVLGYRAPSWSIAYGHPWALDVLASEGFRYDSSILPPGVSPRGRERRFPHLIRLSGGHIAEFPVTTLRLGGLNLPVAGGGYFRLYPYRLTRYALRRINRSERRPFVFYIHPWEFEPNQPRVSNVPALKAFRHYVNLSRTERRFERLLSDFRFGPVREVLEYGLSGGALHLPGAGSAVHLPQVEARALGGI
jgi:polysaccharide deacetylase family protein (PEP-CTERM system associated)